MRVLINKKNKKLVELDCDEALLSPDPSLMGMKQPNKQTDV